MAFKIVGVAVVSAILFFLILMMAAKNPFWIIYFFLFGVFIGWLAKG